jgi:uncharacterized protein (DUF58 family)
MVEVGSGDILGMCDSSVTDLINDLNAKQARVPLGPVLGLGVAGLSLLAILAGGASGSVASGVGAFALLAAIAAWALGAWLDQSLRRSVLFYDLDPEATAKFQRVTRFGVAHWAPSPSSRSNTPHSCESLSRIRSGARKHTTIN